MKLCSRPEVVPKSGPDIEEIQKIIRGCLKMQLPDYWGITIETSLQSMLLMGVINEYRCSRMVSRQGLHFHVCLQFESNGTIDEFFIGR